MFPYLRGGPDYPPPAVLNILESSANVRAAEVVENPFLRFFPLISSYTVICVADEHSLETDVLWKIAAFAER